MRPSFRELHFCCLGKRPKWNWTETNWSVVLSKFAHILNVNTFALIWGEAPINNRHYWYTSWSDLFFFFFHCSGGLKDLGWEQHHARCMPVCTDVFFNCTLDSFQVSHHPPISVFHVTNRKDGFNISGSILARSKFYGECMAWPVKVCCNNKKETFAACVCVRCEAVV